MRLLQYGLVCFALAVAFDSAALAKKGGTPDNLPPSTEDVCDIFSGAAFGLCNAFCEAQDCDVAPKPSCDQLRRNFERQTGLTTFPCEGGMVPTATATRSPMFTPTGTPTQGPPTATRTTQATRTNTAPATRTNTAQATRTNTANATATNTPRRTATATATQMTPEPIEFTPTSTGTAGPIGTTTATATETSRIPTGTATTTPTGPTATATGTGIPVGTATATATPAAGVVCDELSGAAFGLCTAFCFAQDCPNHQEHPACDELRDNFEKLTGLSTFPCEGGVPGTPTATSTPAGGDCECDCAGDGAVTIDDLTHAVLIVLGAQPMGTCPRLIGHGDALAVSDLVRAVVDALNGCS